MSFDQETIYRLKRRRTTDQWGFKITTLDGNKTFISEVFANTPAEKARLEINEIIISINKVPCINVSHDHVSEVIKRVDRNMTLKTRKPFPDEEQNVNQIAENIPVIGVDPVTKNGNLQKTHHRVKEKRGQSRIKNDPDRKPKTSNQSDLGTTEDRDSIKHKHRNHSSSIAIIQEDDGHVQLSELRSQPSRAENDAIMTKGPRAKESTKVRTAKASAKSDKSNKPRNPTEPADLEDSRKTEAVIKRKHRSHHIPDSGADEVDGFQRSQQFSYPSMIELSASIAPGKRRSLLLTNQLSYEERVDRLNDL